MANLSKQKREEFIAKIEALKQKKAIDDTDKLFLNDIINELNEKRYGLIWEKHSETVDEMMINNTSYSKKNVMFKGYQSKDGGKTWQTISLMDYTSVKNIKVLQIYPIDSAKNQLKTWMETNGYGKGIIKVDAVSITDFNANPNTHLKDSSGNWKYDVLFFGTWDGGGDDLSTTSTEIVKQFIVDGKGCIFGHDTIYPAHPNMWTLKDYFNISGYNSSILPMNTEVYICKQGLFTTYPWNIGSVGTVLTIPNAHSQYSH